MDPLTVIVAALTAGAAAAAQDVAERAVKDAYEALKAIIVRKFGHLARVQAAVDAVEQRPSSEGRQEVLREELATAEAHQDTEVTQQAQAFLDLLQEHGLVSGALYRAAVTGSGAIAQGPGAVAAGEGGVAVGGDVEGDIQMGQPWADEEAS
jgi:hypothetical protein